MAKRKVLRVVPRVGGGWFLRGPRFDGVGGALCYPTQDQAVDAGRIAGREWWYEGVTTQLVVHGRSGKILWEATYGRDPRRFKG